MTVINPRNPVVMRENIGDYMRKIVDDFAQGLYDRGFSEGLTQFEVATDFGNITVCLSQGREQVTNREWQTYMSHAHALEDYIRTVARQEIKQMLSGAVRKVEQGG